MRRDELQPPLRGSFTQTPLLGGLETSGQRLAAPRQTRFCRGFIPTEIKPERPSPRRPSEHPFKTNKNEPKKPEFKLKNK